MHRPHHLGHCLWIATVSSGIGTTTSPKLFRGDTAFALPNLMRLLESEDHQYAIRIRSNPDLEREIEYLLTRPVGRRSHKLKVLYHSFQYQAKSRRVVAKIEWHANELFPRVGFIVTNLNKQSKNVVKFSNGRSTAERWIKEGKNAVKWRSSPAARSRTTRCGCNCSPWPTTLRKRRQLGTITQS